MDDDDDDIDEPSPPESLCSLKYNNNDDDGVFNNIAELIIGHYKNAVKKGEQIWDLTAKRMLFNFSIPMLAGGAYCFILFSQNHVELILPATLLFYGLALLNASKYTVDDIKYLGVLLVLLGLFASLYVDKALLLWGIGFGALHIVYGSFMYFKYEK